MQWIRYNQSLDEVLSLKKEIEELQTKVASHQKKHRRSDKEIEKHEKVIFLSLSVHIVIGSMVLRLP
jgi:hypothetical protein